MVGIAQLVEQRTENPRVTSSKLVPGKTKIDWVRINKSIYRLIYDWYINSIFYLIIKNINILLYYYLNIMFFRLFYIFSILYIFIYIYHFQKRIILILEIKKRTL